MTERNTFKLQAAIGFASVIILSSVALVAALTIERRASDRSDRILREYRRGVGAAHHLELGAERLVAAARGYLLSGDPSFRAGLEAERREFEVRVRALERSIISPGQDHLLVPIREAARGYRAALQRLPEGKTGTLDRVSLARVFEQLLVPRRRALREAIESFVSIREQRLAEGRAEVRASVDRAERRVIAIGLVAPLFAAGLAWLISRRLNQLYAAQEESAARAAEAVVHRDDLLGIVAHDLRSPLNGILLRAHILRDDARSPAMRRSAEAIAKTVNRMDLLIEELLDSAAAESGQLQVVTDQCDVNDIVSTALEVFEPVAAEKGVRFATRVEGDAMQMDADRERMVQVLSNLLSNAFKFTGKGGQVELRVARTGDHIRFEVSDSGPGIPADILPRVFDRYWRQRGSNPGVGLGLYIAQAIVTAHGGAITVAQTGEAGTTFRVDLPA